MQGTLLGHFRLLEPLGQGGMGEVWKAGHTLTEERVAIKFLTSAVARERAFHEAFEREVLTMARLHHERIALIVDYGVLASALGEFERGAPFLIMEYVEGRSLNRLGEQLTWEQLARQITDLLDALAHAHARRIIHRDLKPQNILVTPEGVSKLIDFGIALDYDRALKRGRQRRLDGHDSNTITGTPAYMSPEQIEGSWREQGPWTDLYSLGCLIWELLSGTPLFEGGLMVVLAAQLAASPPLLRSRIALPRGFEAWLNLLLHKDPRQRFQRAADALAAFEAIAARFELKPMRRQASDPARLVERAGPEEATLQLALDEGLVDTLERVRRERSRLHLSASQDTKAPPPSPPPLDWRSASLDKPRRLKLLGSGLGLWGVRELPMIGREAQRDLLWQMLLLSARSGAPQLALLCGEPGCGKSKLAAWLEHRAHESGAAHTLRATYSPHLGPLDGLSAMLVRHFELHGLDRGARAAQIVSRLGSSRGVDLAALVELTDLAGVVDTDQAIDFVKRFDSAREQHYALVELLVRLAEERPVVLWIDDVQWGLEAALFLRDLFERSAQSDLPLLVVATERVDGAKSASRPILEELERHASTRRLEVRHLDAEEHEELVEEMLGLEPKLAGQVVRRTQGNPLFAVQLVGDWIARGELRLGPEGFALAPGAAPTLPEDLDALWASRLEHVFGKFAAFEPAELMRALELAAALGQEVSRQEWRHVCALSALELPSSFEQALRSNHLIDQDAGEAHQDFRFAHSMLHEHLIGSAKRLGRAPAHHALIASSLEARPGAPRQRERLARHLMMAEQWERALRPLLEAMHVLVIHADFDSCEVMLEAYTLCLDRLQRPEAHPDVAIKMCYEAQLAIHRGERQRALELLEQVDALIGPQPTWRESEALMLKCASRVLIEDGDLKGARRLIERTVTIHRERGDLSDYGRALAGLAQALVFGQELEQVDELLAESIATLTTAGDEDGLTVAYYVRGLRYAIGKQFEEAREALTTLRDHSIKLGNRRQEANAENALGNLESKIGRYDQARLHQHRALELFKPFGPRFSTAAQISLAYLDVFDSGGAEPERQLERVREISLQAHRWHLARFFHVLDVIELYCLAELGRFSCWDEVHQRLLIDYKLEYSDRALGLAFEILAEQLIERDHFLRARKILSLAAANWRRHDPQRITQTEHLLDRCRLFL